MPDRELVLPNLFELRLSHPMRRVVIAAAWLCYTRAGGVIIWCGGPIRAMATGILMMYVGVLRRRRLHCKRLSHTEASLRRTQSNFDACSHLPLQ